MEKTAYRPRVSDDELRLKMESCGAVLIEGAKWCGKTTSAAQMAKSKVLFNDPDAREHIHGMMATAPSRLLTGEPPVLLDEWQLEPRIWDAVRFEIDQRGGEAGQFLLTGSAVPADMTAVHHSGAGRIARMRMRPMSLYESGESTGEVSLARLFAGDGKIAGSREMELEEMAFLIARGGWPGTINMPPATALRQAQNYYDAIVHADISRVDGIRRSPINAAALMRSYARLVGTQANHQKIVADMKSLGDASLSPNSVFSYVSALEKMFVVEEAANWSPRLRMRAAIRTSATRYFTDPSIAVAALGASPQDIMDDLPTMGLLFENLVIRDLRVYASKLGGEVFHFLNKNGLEVDAVIRLRNGAYGLAEVKLGGGGVEQGAKTLKKFAESVDTSVSRAPAFLMVIIGVGTYAYRREDGVLVVPISTLGA